MIHVPFFYSLNNKEKRKEGRKEGRKTVGGIHIG